MKPRGDLPVLLLSYRASASMKPRDVVPDFVTGDIRFETD